MCSLKISVCLRETNLCVVSLFERRSTPGIFKLDLIFQFETLHRWFCPVSVESSDSVLSPLQKQCLWYNWFSGRRYWMFTSGAVWNVNTYSPYFSNNTFWLLFSDHEYSCLVWMLDVHNDLMHAWCSWTPWSIGHIFQQECVYLCMCCVFWKKVIVQVPPIHLKEYMCLSDIIQALKLDS